MISFTVISKNIVAGQVIKYQYQEVSIIFGTTLNEITSSMSQIGSFFSFVN
jgi:hypothetical protein